MNPYEMTFIIRPDIDEEQMRGVVDQVTRRLETAGGEIIATFNWTPTRRRMAYPIRDFGDGFYVTTVFRLDPQAIRDVENQLKLNESILRFLLVQATEMNIRQAQQRMQQANAPAQAEQPQVAPTVPPEPQAASGVAEETAATETVPTPVAEETATATETSPTPATGETAAIETETAPAAATTATETPPQAEPVAATAVESPAAEKEE